VAAYSDPARAGIQLTRRGWDSADLGSSPGPKTGFFDWGTRPGIAFPAQGMESTTARSADPSNDLMLRRSWPKNHCHNNLTIQCNWAL